MEDSLLTTEQVAKILQIHKFTVLKYIRAGKLKGIKLGRVYRIKLSDVEHFIQQHSTYDPVVKEKAKKQLVKKEEAVEKVHEKALDDDKSKEIEVEDTLSESKPKDEEEGEEEHYVLR